MSEITEILKCPITNDNNTISYFDLGQFPLVNNLCDSRESSINCNRYPLKVNLFTKSKLSCLSHSIPGELLFSNYLFKSEINIPYIDHCKKMYNFIEKLVNLQDEDLIIDIGGNDGTLLNSFKETTEKNLNFLNIDPSKNLSKLSEQKGIPVLNDFFSFKTSKKVQGKAKVITSTNVFQHLRDTNSFVKGICHLLRDDGIWLLEFPYWIHDLETNQFDQIYHEHVYYYSIIPLKLMMEKHGLKIVKVEKQNIHGGTLRLIITKQLSDIQPEISIQDIIDLENKYDIKYYENWGLQVNKHLDNCKNIISDIKSKGKTIAAFGAAAKGCIFLNACGITYKEIDFIIDDTDIKQGKFMPGTGLEIVSREYLKQNRVDYILILAHNFADYIIETFKNDYDGKFIVFLPNIRIIK